MHELAELASKLDSVFDERYVDLEWGLRDFGTEHERDLRRILSDGHTLVELVEVARGSLPHEHQAALIREGMGIAAYLQRRG